MTEHSAIEETAARWLVRRSDPEWSDQAELEFETWMDESFAHMAAFWRLENGDEQLNRLRRSSPARKLDASSRSRPALSRWLALAASLFVMVCGTVFLLRTSDGLGDRKPILFSTEFGQIATIELGDGTQVALNSDSRIRVLEDRNLRRLWLDRGEIYLEAAHDPKRPFSVQAGAAKVTVVGTKFIVSRRRDGSRVSVVEGKVRLEHSGGRMRTPLLFLGAGDVGSSDANSISATTADLKRLQDSLAWREGVVIFDDTPLAEAVMEFNRYNRRKVVILDSRDATTRIGGLFRLDNVDGFARLLALAYGVKVKVDETEGQLSQLGAGELE